MPWDAILIAGKAVLWWGLPLAFAIQQLRSVRRLRRAAQDDDAQSPRSSAEASRRERAAPASRRARS